MMPEILDAARRMRRHRSAYTPGRVLELGAYNVNGTIRDVFQHDATEYVGVDGCPGPCVDEVVDGESLIARFGLGSFDTVLCFETLEHVVFPWLVVEQLKGVLRPGGMLWVSTPTFEFPLHRYPLDCYRFGTDAYERWLFKDFVAADVLLIPNVPVIIGAGSKPA